ncbi:MAG: hypothetical protein FJW66_08135, partial [Actinobacteria bacterium]|nr:hypothetical protein [Actinomycetota bacterium]
VKLLFNAKVIVKGPEGQQGQAEHDRESEKEMAVKNIRTSGPSDVIAGDSSKASRPEPVRVQKVGRNDPCPCGSGKKYKKCCGK